MGNLDGVNAVRGDEVAIAGHRFDRLTNRPNRHDRQSWV
jgi:hypothetical protein